MNNQTVVFRENTVDPLEYSSYTQQESLGENELEVISSSIRTLGASLSLLVSVTLTRMVLLPFQILQKFLVCRSTFVGICTDVEKSSCQEKPPQYRTRCTHSWRGGWVLKLDSLR